MSTNFPSRSSGAPREFSRREIHGTPAVAVVRRGAMTMRDFWYGPLDLDRRRVRKGGHPLEEFAATGEDHMPGPEWGYGYRGLGGCRPHRGGGLLWRRRDDMADHRPR
jgi:hypothetical protein